MALEPYSKVFSYQDAAHLARRTMFGATPENIAKMQKMGLFAAVEQMLNFETNELANNPFDPDKVEKQGEKRNITVQRWVYEMINSPFPFRERLAFFWHNHFVIEIKKVKRPKLIADYLAILRQNSLGNFEDLAAAVSFSPAMLLYLDNAQNQKEHPNENFARELLELFTLGIGNYSELDVTESARALTGWTIIKNRNSPRRGEAIFKAERHDKGSKTILGQTGNFSPEDVVKIAANHKATAQFVAKKLWLAFFSDKPNATAIAEIADSFSAKKNLSDLYFELFTSKRFYESKYSIIKSPLDYLVGTIRSIGVEIPNDYYRSLIFMAAKLGQAPLNPPNVAGWKGGRSWINDSALLDRINLAKTLFLKQRNIINLADDASRLELALLAENNTKIFELLADYDIKQKAFLTVTSPEYYLI